MDGFEIFGFNPELFDFRLRLQRLCHIANQIFNELRVVVGPFGHEFLIGSLKQPPEFAGRLGFNRPNQVVDRQVIVNNRVNRDVRALVVRSIITNPL